MEKNRRMTSIRREVQAIKFEKLQSTNQTNLERLIKMSKKWLLSGIATWKRCFQIQGAAPVKIQKTTKFKKMSLENLNSNQFEFVSTIASNP